MLRILPRDSQNATVLLSGEGTSRTGPTLGTGSGSGRMAAEARRLGASGVFTTPVDVDVLKGAVRNAMA